MNSVDKDKITKAICRISAHLCAYVKKPCDCKFMQDEDDSIGHHTEFGNGCPETMVAALLLAHMTTQEFLSIAERAGINIVDDEGREPLNVFEMA